MAKKIVIGVCGSVAAVEVVKLVRELRRRGIEVVCVITPASQKIIHPYVLQWASENKVIKEITGEVEHVKLCGLNGEASLLLICPATSNTLSKIAHGIDDTAVTTFATTALGSRKPVIIAPAMHHSIYKNPFVRKNIEELKRKGVKFIQPKIEEEKAKLASKEEIIKAVLEVLEND